MPDLPREGFLATYYYVRDIVAKVPQPQTLPWTLGVRRCEVQECDAEGGYRFEGLPRLGPGPEPLPLETCWAAHSEGGLARQASPETPLRPD